MIFYYVYIFKHWGNSENIKLPKVKKTTKKTPAWLNGDLEYFSKTI